MRGFIRQRGSSWTAYWSTIDPATGKRVQHSKGGFTKKEPSRPTPKGDSAREHLNRMLGEVETGTFRKGTPVTVKSLCEDHWAPAQRSRNLRPTTMALYDLAIKSWIVPNIGGVKAAALTPKMVVDLIAKLRTETTASGRDGLSPRSVQIAVTVLKSACRYGAASGLLALDPIASVTTPQASHQEMTIWTEEEARRFLAATRDDRLGWAWAVLLTRGLRRGELCGLKWKDIDLDGESPALRVVRTRVVVNGKADVSEPKTRNGKRRWRSIPLDDLLVAVLRQHKVRQTAERLAAGEAYESTDMRETWLFADELGRPYYPDSLSEWFDAKVKALGLTRIRLHDTRHTAASIMLVVLKMPVQVVSEILGHSSEVVTLTVYGHLLPGVVEEAGAAMSARLLGGM